MLRFDCVLKHIAGKSMDRADSLSKRVNWAEGIKMLQLMPPGDSMDMGKGYDNMIGCATYSLSQRLIQKVLLPCFILVVSSCFNPHVWLIVRLETCINSVDMFIYPYALPILHSSYLFSSLCLSCNLSSSLRSLQKRDNKNQVMLKKEWLEIRVMEKE